ncbi:MAG TPA: tetratricopeptide repeat protein [Pyrinomonadaceae bacterium]|nr:tetratricopeptide repeat protein [Pyrinomonadaceae bacterium]
MRTALLCFAFALTILSTAGSAEAGRQKQTPAAKPKAKATAPAAKKKPGAGAQAAKAKAPAAKPKASPAAKPTGEEALKAELAEIVKLASAAERVERLKSFLKANEKSPLRPKAQELLTSARAALGDERLRSSDRAGGIELFRAAVLEAPAEMPDKLFFEVVSQLPANLYVLGEREAAFELARAVEERASSKAPRLLSVAAFYLGAERPEEAERVARQAVALQPDMAAAHQALGAAYRFSLRLDEAAAEYARALELDPKSAAARRSLADLKRATGKAEEALALYREQLAAEPQDSGARAGLVLSLFDAGRRAEAERELEAALMEQASNLPLLVGASYWYAAHGEAARAIELAERAVALEPRYRWVWTRVALARALLAARRPLDAERELRRARSLGSFPTLDYELAVALAAAGLYEEAAEELSRSFRVENGQIVTRLAGRVEARGADFEELLAPERRAGLFQFKGAGKAAEARTLKGLLAFHEATRAAAADGALDDSAAEAAREFASGDDAMRAYRNLYVADRLAQRSPGHKLVLERAEAAIGGVDAALSTQVAPIALFAGTEEMRMLRQRVVETGEPLNYVGVQPEVLSRVMRGRIEELAGWALYNQGRTAEAVVRLRRAVSVLPEGTIYWRSAEWRLGAALEASGSAREALAAYVKSYRARPDETRRSVIEALYKRLNNGSTSGLEELLDPSLAAPATASARPTPRPQPTPEVPEGWTPIETKRSDATGSASAESSPAKSGEPAATPSETTKATPTQPEASPSPSPSPPPTPTPSPSPEAPPAPAPSPAAAVGPSPTPAQTEAATPTPSPEQPKPTPSPGPQEATRKSAPPAGACTLALSEPSVAVKANGGRATVTLTAANHTGAAPPRIQPSTPNWADIIVLAEPRTASDDKASVRFTVMSTSGKAGPFVVNFASPCGKQQLAVNVQ